MKYRTALLFSVCFVLYASLLVLASDVSGKWTAQVPGRGGQTREQTFNFKVEGAKLTGTVSGMQGDNPISDGTVKGDDISFTVVFSFNGNDVKLHYQGKVSGDEIKFTRTREGGQGQGQEFTAKRVK
jgi:hypothetical protein